MKLRITERDIRKIIREEIEKSITGNTAVKIAPSLPRCKKMSGLIMEFCNYAADALGIKRDLVNIEIVDNRNRSGIKTTAYYDPNNHDIVIYGKDRAVVDVCRSIAHEMTHMSQMLENRIEFPVQDAGGEIEDEANAKAGEIIKLFAKSNPDRSRIYESRRSRKLR